MPPVSEPDSVPEEMPCLNEEEETTEEENAEAFYQKTNHEEQKQSYNPEAPAGLSLERMQEVARLMEERRKERMKTLTRNLEVCDLLDIRNPQSVAEYAPQIYKFLHQEELRHIYPQEFIVGNQQEITEKMRAYLIDWLSELHGKFKLWAETLYVCVGIIDKFIMLQPDIKKKDLQCLGITALHISGKYEEIYPPELRQILRVTDNAVTKEQVLQLEF